MLEHKKDIRVAVDTYTRVLLTLIAILLTVLILGLWTERVPPLASDANAGELFLDSSAQRSAQVKAQEQTTQKIGELIRLLESGKVKVQVVQEPGKPAGEKHVEESKIK
jgi:hypothetical protein